MGCEVICGDCRDVLKTLPDESVQMCVTSPPYWGLRDYGVDRQLGLEATPEEYVAHMVEVFREVKRVLRPDATLWINLGDSFSNKQLVGIPWRVAFALQADGWYLRSDCIWHKPNPMPESVTDRPTKAHEYVFLFAKSAKYYYDNEAVKEANADPCRTSFSAGKRQMSEDMVVAAGDKHRGFGATGRPLSEYAGQGRNRRSVWTIATRPYSGAHFATFPEALVEPCILAGTSERGACPTCGAPWERVVEKEKPPREVFTETAKPETVSAIGDHTVGMGQKLQDWYNEHPAQTSGWRPTCDCGGDPVPCVVLDPFGGAGTVGVVAKRLGRDAVLIDLNQAYVEELARPRIERVQPALELA